MKHNSSKREVETTTTALADADVMALSPTLASCPGGDVRQHPSVASLTQRAHEIEAELEGLRGRLEAIEVQETSYRPLGDAIQRRDPQLDRAMALIAGATPERLDNADQLRGEIAVRERALAVLQGQRERALVEVSHRVMTELRPVFDALVRDALEHARAFTQALRGPGEWLARVGADHGVKTRVAYMPPAVDWNEGKYLDFVRSAYHAAGVE